MKKGKIKLHFYHLLFGILIGFVILFFREGVGLNIFGVSNIEEQIGYWEELDYPISSMEFIYPTKGNFYGLTPEGALTRMGKGSLSIIKLSPDGNYLAAGTSIGLYMFDANTYSLLWFQSIRGLIDNLSFSEDSSRIAGPFWDGFMVFDVKTGEKLKDYDEADFNFEYVYHENNQVISPDGKYLAIVEKDYIEILDNDSLKKYKLIMLGDFIDLMAWSPDSKWIAVITSAGGEGDEINFIKVKSGKIIKGKLHSQFTTFPSFATTFTWAHDSSLLFIGGTGGSISAWDPWSGERVFMFSGHNDSVINIQLFPGDDGMISGDIEGHLIERKNNGVFTEIELGFIHGIYSMDWSPDGTTIITGSWGGEMVFWDVKTGKIKTRLNLNSDKFWKIAYSPDGSRIAGIAERRLIAWDAETRTKVFSLGGNYKIWDFDWSLDGERLAATTFREEILIINGQTGEIQQTFGRYDVAGLWEIKWFPDDNYLIVGITPNQVNILDIVTGDWILQVNLDSDEFEPEEFGYGGSSITYLPSKEIIVAQGSFSSVAFIDLKGNIIKEFNCDEFAVSPDERLIAIREYWPDEPSDGEFITHIALFDLLKWEFITLIPDPHFGGILKWSPDGTLLASGGDDGTIVLWDMTPYLAEEEE